MRINVAALLRPRIAQSITNARTQLLIDPFLDRDTKSLLRPVENFGRNQISDCSLEQVFGLEPGQLQGRGNACDKLDQLVIEQRRSRLQRHSHTHAIDFREYVAGQISLTVEIQQTIERLFTLNVLDQFIKETGDIATWSKLSRKVRRVKRSPIQVRENRNTVEISRNRIEGNVVQVVASPCGVRQSLA